MRSRCLAPVFLALGAALATPSARALSMDGADAFAEATPSRQDTLYEEGTAALDAKKYDKALAAFPQAASAEGPRADAALYWKAYAESRLNRRSDASATLGELRRRFPKSRWLKDASALELEMRHGSE